MNCRIKGDLVNVVEKKDKKQNKFFVKSVIQKENGTVELIRVFARDGKGKEGDKVEMAVRVFPFTGRNGEALLNVWEV